MICPSIRSFELGDAHVEKETAAAAIVELVLLNAAPDLIIA